MPCMYYLSSKYDYNLYKKGFFFFSEAFYLDPGDVRIFWTYINGQTLIMPISVQIVL